MFMAKPDEVKWIQINEDKLNDVGMTVKQARNYRLIRCVCGNEWGVTLRLKDSKALLSDLVCRNCGRKYEE